MGMLVKEVANFKRTDNFQIDQLNGVISKTDAKLKEIRTKEKKEKAYLEMIMFQHGQTEQFKKLNMDLQEYDSIRIQTPPFKGENDTKFQYSDVNRELRMIFTHLILAKSDEDDDLNLEDIDRAIQQIPKDCLYDLFEEKATALQKKTAYKIIERVIHQTK